jgi:hypothetical protein
VSKVPAVDQNRYHLSIANLAQFRAKFGTGKFFLFVFAHNKKSGEELRYSPVPRYLGTSSLVIALQYSSTKIKYRNFIQFPQAKKPSCSIYGSKLHLRNYGDFNCKLC